MKRMRTAWRAVLGAGILLLSLVTGWFGALTLEGAAMYDTQHWQETGRFYNLLYNDAGFAKYHFSNRLSLEKGMLDYIQGQTLKQEVENGEARLDRKNTWFRFQVKSKDGQEVLYSNLSQWQELTEVVQKVEYETFDCCYGTQGSGNRPMCWNTVSLKM